MTLCGPTCTAEEIADHDAGITPGEFVLCVWDGTESTLYNLFIKWGKEMPHNSLYTMESISHNFRPDEYIPAQITKRNEWMIELEPGDKIVRTAELGLRIDRD